MRSSTMYQRNHLRPTTALPGPAGQARIAADFRRAFPDLQFTVDLLFGEDDLVAARWTATGTHTGTWDGLEPTDRRVTFFGREPVPLPRREGRGHLEPPRRPRPRDPAGRADPCRSSTRAGSLADPRISATGPKSWKSFGAEPPTSQRRNSATRREPTHGDRSVPGA